MPFGKLYSSDRNPRATAIKAVAKQNGLELEIIDTNAKFRESADYRRLNRLGKIPTFEGSDGYVLSEAIAIAIYITSQNEKTTLLGKTKQDYASMLKWMSFANQEILTPLGAWYLPLRGLAPYNKKAVDESQKAALQAMKVLEDYLLVNTYLVGERLTLADLFVTGIIARGYQFVFDKAFREKYANVTRYYETVYNQPIYSDVAPKLEYIDEAIKYQPPKKDAPPKKDTAVAAAAAKAKKGDDDDEEEDKPAPKPKHPLEALGKANFVLDDWKRKYSNEDTREVALPWFWQNCNFEEYSLYRVDYKYNDELTMTFMTSNLIGGFFNRLEASRKYLFGACSVYGVTNDSIVRGAFVVRGQEALPAFDVAPDADSYEFTKLNPKDDKDKEFVNDMWAWDKPIEANNKSYEWADGKVFK